MQAQCIDVDIHESGYKLEWMEHPWADVDAAGNGCSDLERRLQPDLIHLNNYAHGNLQWNALRRCGGAFLCLLLVERGASNFPASRMERVSSARVQAGLHAADAVVAFRAPCFVNWSNGMACSASVRGIQRTSSGTYAPGDERKFCSQHGPGLGCGEKHRSP